MIRSYIQHFAPLITLRASVRADGYGAFYAGHVRAGPYFS